ncbi:MAG: hypothetical protein E5X49_27310 [Mesorhizobium sp.]|uniref:hypothetical protein n=1 Tax=Mesorhizobium sp. TaxID=1871066 RepID=UPI000FE48823|nr:hypothetical protein [Mesorhizobium sp.]RWA66096.1 MAG: hypothetical protein EOQ28_28470 [Mesorhizobium sp.]RWB95970.1 MAG: hypothetical protein EOQ57_27975 [Mesorhizobium sp.]RWK05209.1 MAG: hypothetical protein EOR39_27075 [Mesorhizobium sp.]TIQ39571.1 MAG: hypothetical protein E5X49_27310 [Mesorhizobium sp.]TIQ45492.1 MAG: hypothetical protein E5X47_26375 [Mesorhizobium sp.]
MKKVLLGFAIVLLSGPAMTATGQPLDPQIEDCQVKPDDNAAPKQRGEQLKAQADDQSNNLSSSLANCGGVLKPPPTGDQNTTVPPSNTSQMPVIRPGEVPPQTSK